MKMQKSVHFAVLVFALAMVLIFIACENNMSPTTPVTRISEFKPAALSSTTADIVVNSTLDVRDFGDPNTVAALPGPDSLVTLREAIIAANHTAGAQTIAFNIPTSDPAFDGSVFNISLESALPRLDGNGTVIDGSTQADFTGDSNPAGPEIMLDGSSTEWPGLTLNASNIHIHHLVLNHFPMNVIVILKDATYNTITGCYIGVDPTGETKVGNQGDGILLQGDYNQIGGPSVAERNVVSGNSRNGLQMGGHYNVIENNFFGANALGTKVIGNGESGLANVEGTHNLFKNNLISGNDWDGIQFWSADENTVKGNRIGVDINGNPGLGNSEFGIRLTPGDDVCIGNQIIGNTIASSGRGGLLVGDADHPVHDNRFEKNKIFENQGGGIILLFQSMHNTLTQNSIYSNHGLGIDLDWDGVTLNDEGDEDTGTNNLLNFPILTRAHATRGKLIVQGTIDTPNPREVTIEFFANPVPTPGADPSGHGEGAVYLGSTTPNPKGKFTAPLPTVDPGTFITATTTDAAGNTSEFAANFEATSH